MSDALHVSITATIAMIFEAYVTSEKKVQVRKSRYLSLNADALDRIGDLSWLASWVMSTNIILRQCFLKVLFLTIRITIKNQMKDILKQITNEPADMGIILQANSYIKRGAVGLLLESLVCLHGQLDTAGLTIEAAIVPNLCDASVVFIFEK